jgi:hypothetical protein
LVAVSHAKPAHTTTLNEWFRWKIDSHQKQYGKLAGDFFGPLASGHYLIAMICETTGYPLVEALTSRVLEIL